MVVRSRYRIEEPLGAGAMGTVYAVRDLLGGGRVALKALWPEAGSADLVASLRSEFGVLAALRDPLLCRVFDFGRLPPGSDLPGAPEGAAAGDGVFYTRELVTGLDLGRAAAEAGRAVAPICRWLAWAARGLDALHRAGLRHGDFKPANAIVCGPDREQVRLIDFGLAGAETASRRAGTLVFMAPELLRGGSVDRRADLYALGVALWQLVTGHSPAGDRSRADLVEWHLGRERPNLATARPDAPASLVELASRLMARDPDERLPTAGEAVAALEACADAAGTAGRSNSARGSRSPGGSARRSPGGSARSPGGSADPVDAPVFPPVGQACVAILERAFERRRSGQGGPALIELTGAAGSGKSTVLTQLAWRVQLAGGEVVRAQPGPESRARPALDAVVSQVEALCGGRSAPGEVAASDPHQVAGAIAQLLLAASRDFPLLVVLDDLDFADVGSRALAPHVALALPASAPVLLVASRTTADDGAAAGTPQTAPAIGQVARVHLPPVERRPGERAGRARRRPGGFTPGRLGPSAHRGQLAAPGARGGRAGRARFSAGRLAGGPGAAAPARRVGAGAAGRRWTSRDRGVPGAGGPGRAGRPRPGGRGRTAS